MASRFPGLLLVSGLTSLGHSVGASLAAERHAAEVTLLVHITLAGFREASPSKIQPSYSPSAGLPASGSTGPAGPAPLSLALVWGFALV